ncbi:MAG: putative toxin-antitoxin system toxin component, PIN family [Kiritimatiellaeota bacterium]|nr:putative toxin-antitoxin system toxin component, PIN family [Kiritimatiellota bacterium]
MRVIVDANVAIAAVAARGLCEAVVELCLERHQLIFCADLIVEMREKLTRKLKVPPPTVAEFLKMLCAHAEMLEPAAVARNICRDPDDVMLLGLAEAGHADAIITGDKDLLVIKSYATTRILTPREFWELHKQVARD